MSKQFNVIIIGAGPAGMAAAIAASDSGVSVALIERDEKIGGILRQCIHDGFGLIRFKEALTGPEYAYKYKQMVMERNIKIYTKTFLRKIEKTQNSYKLHFVNPNKGDFTINGDALIMAMGCRERTDRQIFIHGDRPAGIFTAGQAQNFINLKGQTCCKRCVILGSGDIGLIMARRLTLEGIKVAGVYEIQSSPGGLTRNIVQCLNDYNIPLELSTSVIKVHGRERVEAVSISKVDHNFKPIKGTEKKIECDALILSVGLIPENDILDPLFIEIDKRTRGPKVDQDFQTMEDGIFSCGNALHVNDLVDYVSESGEIAGKAAANYVKKKNKNRSIIRNTRKRRFTLPSAGNDKYKW